MADEGRPRRHARHRYFLGLLRPLRRGRDATRPRAPVHRHAASGARGPPVPLGLWSRRNRHARIWPHQRARGRRLRSRLFGSAGERYLAAQPLLPDAANRRRAAASPPHRGNQGRVLAAAGLARGGHDRLPRDHQPLCRRRHYRRDGRRLFVVGDERAARIRRPRHRRARACRAVSRACHQIGIARAHDPHADGNLSGPRRRPARARRPDRARHRRADRCRRLVQRSARLHAHHRHRARAGHPAAQRLCRRRSSRRSRTTAAMCSS